MSNNIFCIIVFVYLFDGSWLREQVVDGVDGHPHHGAEADHQAHDLGPLRELVSAVRHRRVRVDVVEEHALINAIN